MRSAEDDRTCRNILIQVTYACKIKTPHAPKRSAEEGQGARCRVKGYVDGCHGGRGAGAHQ